MSKKKAKATNIKDQWKYIIRWQLKDKQPPGPIEIGYSIVDAGQPCPEELKAKHTPGSGYFICIDTSYGKEVTIKRWSPERKASVRKKRLISRLEKKFPLFKDEFYQREIDNRADYFKGN